MNLRKSIITALLIAVGFILSQVVPGVIVGMKFDLMLAMIFICILVNPEFKNTLITAALGGMITAMTTTFPGGQLPNIIDKFIVCMAIYFIIKMASKYKNNLIFIGTIGFIGTIISGTTFLTSALFIVGLPAPFKVLMTTIVLPTAAVNTFVIIVVYKAVNTALKLSCVRVFE